MSTNLVANHPFNSTDPRVLRNIIATLIIQAGGSVELDMDRLWAVEHNGATILCSEVNQVGRPGDKTLMTARRPLTARIELPNDDVDFVQIIDSQRRVIGTFPVPAKETRKPEP